MSESERDRERMIHSSHLIEVNILRPLNLFEKGPYPKSPLQREELIGEDILDPLNSWERTFTPVNFRVLTYLDRRSNTNHLQRERKLNTLRVVKTVHAYVIIV